MTSETASLARATVEALRADARRRKLPWDLTETEAAKVLAEGSGDTKVSADVIAAGISLGLALGDAKPDASPPDGSVVIVQVPSPAWVNPMRQAAGACLWGPGRVLHEGAALRNVFDMSPERDVVVFARDGSSREHSPDRGNDVVGEALMAGATILGIAVDPDTTLPKDLVAAADKVVRTAPVDGDVVALVIEAVTGRPPSVTVGQPKLTSCEPGILRAFVRYGKDADDVLARLMDHQAARGRRATGPTLAEMHGFGPARDWGLALAADLRSWRAGSIRFSECESAALLSGPPGCGKTRFAMSLARTVDLPLHVGSLGQWQGARDGHLGHTLGAMRQFFDEARQAPCVVLVDEIDSFGSRDHFPEDHRNYSSQVVNALLEHLDGAQGREGVVVVATTNHPSRLDPALLRSGRLDRHFEIALPDADELALILRHYLGDDCPDLDLRPIALSLRGKSGADVEASVLRARGRARRAGRSVTGPDLMTAVDGDGPRMTEPVRRRCAVHEAGHAVAMLAGGSKGPITLSIGPTGGLAELGDGDGFEVVTETSLLRYLVMALAGRAAEELVLGDASSSAASDLAAATRLAAAMETGWGFSSNFPLVSFGSGTDVDIGRMPWLMAPVRDRLQGAYARAGDLLRNNHDALLRIADALLVEGYLDDGRTRALYAGPAAKGPRKGRSAHPNRARETQA